MKELGTPLKFRVEFMFRTNLKRNVLSHSQHRAKTTEFILFFPHKSNLYATSPSQNHVCSTKGSSPVLAAEV